MVENKKKKEILELKYRKILKSSFFSLNVDFPYLTILWEKKKSFSRLSESIVFGLKKITFRSIFSSKG